MKGERILESKSQNEATASFFTPKAQTHANEVTTKRSQTTTKSTTTQTLTRSETNRPDQPKKQKSWLNWYNCKGIIFLDKYKSASFYMMTNSFLISILLPTKKLNYLDREKIQIQINLTAASRQSNQTNLIYSQVHNSGYNRNFILKNDFYTATTIRLHLTDMRGLILGLNNKSLEINDMTYQIRMNDFSSDTLYGNIIYHKSSPRKTARLTKCLFLTESPNAETDFKQILNLTMRFNYDSVYICNFNDQRIHEILQSSDSVTEILLDRVPNFINDKGDFKKFADIGDNAMFDPVSEFLYNLMYPPLIDSYEHVFAGDYDQLLVPTVGKNISSYLDQVMKSNDQGSKEKTSVYMQQYWYLENRHARVLIENIHAKISGSADGLKFPFHVENNVYETFNFAIRVSNQNELDHAKLMTQKFENATNKVNDMCRVIYIMFKHSSIYGQTVHATQS